jgi:hypothetical protein
MSAVELELRELGAALDLGPERDLSAAVVARVRARRRRRRVLVVAFAVVAVLVAAALAVPDARSRLFDWFGIGAVRVELVDRLPPVEPRTELVLGREVTAAEAARELGRPVPTVDQDDLGAPDAIWAGPGASGRRVSLVWGSERRPRLLVQVFAGRVAPEVGKKVAASGTDVRFASVNGRPAVGLFGDPHFLYYLDPRTGDPVGDRPYLAANVFLWQLGDLTLRLEGDLTFAQMTRIARATR